MLFHCKESSLPTKTLVFKPKEGESVALSGTSCLLLPEEYNVLNEIIKGIDAGRSFVTCINVFRLLDIVSIPHTIRNWDEKEFAHKAFQSGKLMEPYAYWLKPRSREYVLQVLKQLEDALKDKKRLEAILKCTYYVSRCSWGTGSIVDLPPMMESFYNFAATKISMADFIVNKILRCDNLSDPQKEFLFVMASKVMLCRQISREAKCSNLENNCITEEMYEKCSRKRKVKQLPLWKHLTACRQLFRAMLEYGERHMREYSMGQVNDPTYRRRKRLKEDTEEYIGLVSRQQVWGRFMDWCTDYKAISFEEFNALRNKKNYISATYEDMMSHVLAQLLLLQYPVLLNDLEPSYEFFKLFRKPEIYD